MTARKGKESSLLLAWNWRKVLVRHDALEALLGIHIFVMLQIVSNKT
jgi:hypothetical protein